MLNIKLKETILIDKGIWKITIIITVPLVIIILNNINFIHEVLRKNGKTVQN